MLDNLKVLGFNVDTLQKVNNFISEKCSVAISINITQSN